MRPAVGLVLMTLSACIGAAGRDRNIRSRNPHAVIPSCVDAHVDLGWHMTGDTGTATTGHGMAVVSWCIIGFGLMALGADTVPIGY
ncbi:MAG: Uncharacterised protein [Halieaceae bacterium]|nr:MAG: Uncharacterised protein [Halieaceae bacterium]